MQLKLLVKANGSAIQSIMVNGKKVSWKNVDDAIGIPLVEINAVAQPKYVVKIVWTGNKATAVGKQEKYINGDKLNIQFPGATVLDIKDPQQILAKHTKKYKQHSRNYKYSKRKLYCFCTIKAK